MFRRFKLYLLYKLLNWYVAKELDQFDIWEFDTPHGQVWVEVTRASPYEDLPAK